MDKELFDEAIGEPPPSTVDVDRIVTRERRATVVRVVTSPWVATAGAVVALAFGAVAVLGPTGSTGASAGSPAPATASPPPPSPSPVSTWSACPGNTPFAPPVREQPTDTQRRLSAVLADDVQALLPPDTKKIEANPAAEYPKGTPHGAFQFFHVYSQAEYHGAGCRGGEDYFMARATIVGAGKGNISAVIGRLGGIATPETECRKPAAPEQTLCERRTGPQGETIVVTTLSTPDGVRVHRVDVSKTDGTGIILDAGNVAADSKKGPPESANPPLDHEQLTRIALDSRMTLYP